MIVDEAGLTWRRIRADADTDTGGECAEYQSVEHQRLTWLQQRQFRDGPLLESYHVVGLSNYYPSAAAAIEAMRANLEE